MLSSKRIPSSPSRLVLSDVTVCLRNVTPIHVALLVEEHLPTVSHLTAVTAKNLTSVSMLISGRKKRKLP